MISRRNICKYIKRLQQCQCIFPVRKGLAPVGSGASRATPARMATTQPAPARPLLFLPVFLRHRRTVLHFRGGLELHGAAAFGQPWPPVGTACRLIVSAAAVNRAVPRLGARPVAGGDMIGKVRLRATQGEPRAERSGRSDMSRLVNNGSWQTKQGHQHQACIAIR